MTAATAHPFFDFFNGWDAEIGAELDVRVEQMPRVVPTGWKCGQLEGDGPPLASGCIDALAEQLVAGADNDGDVLVILGTTLIIWAVTTSEDTVPGYWTIPHTGAGQAARGRPEQRRWVVLQLGVGLAGRVDERCGAEPRAGVGAVSARRAFTVARSRPTRRARRPRPHPRRGRDPTRRVRGVGVRRAAHARHRTQARWSRPEAARADRWWCSGRRLGASRCRRDRPAVRVRRRA